MLIFVYMLIAFGVLSFIAFFISLILGGIGKSLGYDSDKVTDASNSAFKFSFFIMLFSILIVPGCMSASNSSGSFYYVMLIIFILSYIIALIFNLNE